MRKNNLFLLILMALIVMSCSKDETTMSISQDSVVEFGTYVERTAQTRASVINEVALQTKGFGVFAYYTNGGDYEATSIPNFMYNTEVKGTGWTYSPTKYWPNGSTDKLTFFAYAPHSTSINSNITALSANDKGGDPTLKFTANGTVKDQSDLLYADATNLKNKSKQTVTGKVVFPFKHALSRIGFKVEVMADKVNDNSTGIDDDGTVTSESIASGTTVSVEKVELIGKFTTSSTFNFATNTWTAPTTDAGTEPIYPLVYDATAATSNFDNTVATNVTNTAQVLNKDDSYIMIIPKTFDDGSDPLKIRVTYKVTTTDADLLGGKSEITNVITSDPFPFPFTAGKAYSFNLHLGLNSIKFDATVTDWAAVTPETVVNVPINSLEPESNSYIVAPNSKGIYIPVSRANQSSMLGAQLGTDEEFTAELVWTDNENGIATNSNIAEIGVGGKGPKGYLFVKPGSAEGNAVVAVKKDGKILWSWHIWVTSETPKVVGDRGFMDRNLGAIGNTPGEVGTKGLLYQWGRKDPFPGSTTIDGAIEPTLYSATTINPTIVKTAVNETNNFANSVANPTTFYFNSVAPFDWYTNVGDADKRNDQLWYDGTTTKTIYDPCPAGWCMPKNGAWDGLNPVNFELSDDNKGRTNESYGGFYPLAGNRLRLSGSFNRIGSRGSCWSATVVDANAYYLWFSNSAVSSVSPNSYLGGRAYSNSVRCIKE